MFVNGKGTVQNEDLLPLRESFIPDSVLLGKVIKEGSPGLV
jgi:hypothetical protein